MTDNEHKNPDAEVLNMEELAAANLSSNPAKQDRQDKPGGAGLVWFLAFALLAGGGTYAAWPYIGSTVTPMLQKAQTMLGLQSRPTQPTLPSEARQTEKRPPAPASSPASAPALEPQYAPTDLSLAKPTPPVDQNATPAAPQFAPQSAADFIGADKPNAPAVTEPAQQSSDALPVMAVSTLFERRLNERMDALEDQLKATSSVANKITKDDTSGKLAQVIAELRDEVKALNARIKRLESAPRGVADPSASAQALVLSVTQLATQAESAQPFSTALDALERIGGKDPVVAAALDILRAYGDVGVPTQDTLSEQFNGVAGTVMKVHSQSQRPAGGVRFNVPCPIWCPCVKPIRPASTIQSNAPWPLRIRLWTKKI
ncbi:COG4223 family protein [Magnetovibrio blakemorei]|uniref:Uncharacterized protein n=1 Tax=Magnetovibrio blakemorei TaxID=28181 RepID=A0A1E5Q396_9PROT|nr:mitofilin family membrane protein [Magnetovibrio blakemorei]OEJ64085.1 hypothetical protein BEN30_01390 [Magnetovibrio blakemorei]